MEISFQKDEGKTIIYTNCGTSWKRTGSGRIPRKIDSVILDPELKSLVLNDIEEFFNSSKWYTEKGAYYL